MSRKFSVIVSAFMLLFLSASVSAQQSSKRFQIEPLTDSELEQTTQSKRWGLLIGIEDYEDPLVTDLRYSIDDVRKIAEVLQDTERGAFQHLKILTSDAPEEQNRPTRINIMAALNNWLSGAKPEDTVLFFFSGHGATDDRNRNYLIPVDAKINLLEDSAIPMRRVNEVLDDRKRIAAEKVIVILDSCHSGSKVGQKALTVEGKILDPLFTNAEGRITFASCDRDESSYENEKLGHGVFSYYMAEGLEGSGDRDSDGYIDADELFTYVLTNVQSWTKQRGYKQTPRKQANVTGSILVGYHPENLKRKQKDAAQKMFDEYRRKLRTIIELDIPELTQAEEVLKREMMEEALTETDAKWSQLVRNLAN